MIARILEPVFKQHLRRGTCAPRLWQEYQSQEPSKGAVTPASASAPDSYREEVMVQTGLRLPEPPTLVTHCISLILTTAL